MMKRSVRWSVAASVLAALAALGTVAVPGEDASAPRSESIRREDMKPDMAFLASDALRGRLTGSPELVIAAEFIKARLERVGTEGAGPGGSFFQSFDLLAASLGPGNALEVVERPALRLRFRPGTDFTPHRFSPSGSAQGAVVFAGFGVRASDFGPQVKGRVALVLDHEPGEFDPASPFDGLVTSDASTPWRKAVLAQESGALAVLFVRDVHNHPEPFAFESWANDHWPADGSGYPRFTLREWAERVRIPAAEVSPAVAEELVRGSGRSLPELARAAEAAGGHPPVPLPGPTVELTVSVERRSIRGMNVLGMVRGSDPALRNECVIICAHHDHNGVLDGQVMPGADDDVSGVVAVIDIAEAYVLAAAEGRAPRRSVVFASWDAEERGLLGAWAYAEHPSFPLPETVAVLNLDMIGRNEEVPGGDDWRYEGLEVQTAEANRDSLNILGLSRFPALRAPLDGANRPFGLRIKTVLDNNSSQLLRRSDHWPFLNKGVPALWFLTGIHPDYHTPRDVPERIVWDKTERIARMVYALSRDIADRSGPLR